MYGYPVRDEIFDKIKEFVNGIDKPGAILAIYDEGKIFARNELLNYEAIYSKMLHYIFTETTYIKVRVGGYSYRVECLVSYIIKDKPSFKDRIDYGIDIHNIKFDKDSDFIKLADEYDFKGFDGHSCVYYYINNIESGFTDSNGQFCEFYGAKYKGFRAVEEVVMTIGYGTIPPATAAIHTYSSSSSGDMLICGGGKLPRRNVVVRADKTCLKSITFPTLIYTRFYRQWKSFKRICKGQGKNEQ